MRQVLQKAMRIPRFGFAIEEQHIIFSPDKALEALTPARQRKSTFAVFENNHVMIAKHVIVCPRCGKTMPAYYSRKIKSHPLLNVWLSQQISFFDELPSVLVFNNPIEEMSFFISPKCNMKSHQSKGFVDVLFAVDKRKIKISRKLELQEWFQIEWGADKICITEFELYETITFNLRNGHTFVSLEDGCGEKLQIRDISNIRPDLYSDDPIFELINLYKPVNRELKNRFVKIFHGPLPFRTKELTVEQFVLMTRFIGYDSGFYNALPYAEKGDLIERRFLKSAKRLHRAVKVPNIFEKTTLPKVKSIRKLLFCNPALFFIQRNSNGFGKLSKTSICFEISSHLKIFFLNWRSYIKCRVLSISMRNIRRKSGSEGYIIISFGQRIDIGYITMFRGIICSASMIRK